MKLEVAKDAEAAARLAAIFAAHCIRQAVAVRKQAHIAFSGGTTPRRMLELLATEDLPWESLHVFQVDERVVPRGDERRNLNLMQETLVADGFLRPDHLHAMPVDAGDTEAAAREYQQTLESFAGAPVALDLVQLGLGTDGHTASLYPGDPTVSVQDRDVAAAGVHAGLQRLTLTLPAINRARTRMWLVTSSDKAARLRELVAGEGDRPACLVRRDESFVIADRAAATPG
jgi:6-phosphogluconolactonase